MATAEEYARWIEANASKRGTPEFEEVANAYRAARSAGDVAAPAQAATKNADIASQAGLALRAGAKAAASLPAMMADAVTGPLNWLQDKALGQGQGYRFQSQMPALDRALTAIGLPVADTPTQRIVEKGLEVGLGAGGAAKAVGLAARGANGLTSAALRQMSADPGAQTMAGMGAGLAGQHSAENGGGWGSQMVSSLVGGLVGAGATNLARSGAAKLESLIAPSTKPADIEKRITIALQSQGVDPASITPALKSALIKDVEAALKLNKGTLDEHALARLADYRRLGLSPTVGRVTLDPLAVTQEQNAMRTAAAMGVREAQLPQIAAANNRGLLNAVEDLGPVNDRVGIGSSMIAPIRAQEAARKANVDSLYQAARDSSGRSLELDGAAFANQAVTALQKNLSPKLGAEVDDVINNIATGKTPLTVEYAEQLKTMLGRKAAAAKATQGDLAHAYGLVRDALDNAPLRGAPQVNPGNLPAVRGTVPPSPMVEGKQAIDAFNAARLAARERFAWQDSTPGIKSALEGATQADNFLQNHIISRTASAADVAKLRANLDPAGVDAAKSGIVDYLKQSAIGKGNSTDTANFSGRQWSAALDNLGKDKLRLFFSPEEIEQLRAIGRVGAVETFQPRGSAVNNSNTAAGMAGLVSKASKFVTPFASKVPFGQELVNAPLGNIQVSLMERGAQNIPRGLLQVAPTAGGGLLDQLLLPGLVAGGLLSAQP